MRRTFFSATLIVLVVITPTLIRGQKDKGIVGVMPAQAARVNDFETGVREI